MNSAYVIAYPISAVDAMSSTNIMHFLYRENDWKDSPHGTTKIMDNDVLMFDSIFKASMYIKNIHEIPSNYMPLDKDEIEKFDVYEITFKRVGKCGIVNDIIATELELANLKAKLELLYETGRK